MLNEIISQTAVQLAAQTRSGSLSAREVVEAHLDRIDEVNGTINAIVAARARKDVLTDADAADALPAGQRGALHGLPVAVKDLQNVAHLPTRAGSVTTSDKPAAKDGLVAARLRAAGAIIVGKTNTPEFGTGCHTFNEVYGTTSNPWDPSRVAGGSSGGAAAALASRMLPIADGSDLGGSLRNPAAFCGVVGLRPSIGRVPIDPALVDSSAWFRRFGVEGPMGRNVADTALLLSVLAGPLADDLLSLPDDPSVYARPLPTTTTATIGWVGDLGILTYDNDPFELAKAAAGRVVDVGGSMVEITPDLSVAEEVFRVFRGLSYRKIGEVLPESTVAMTKITVQENIAFGRSLDLDRVMRAAELRSQLHRSMARAFEQVDVIALPTTQVVPFPVDVEYPTEIAGQQMDDYLGWMMSNCVITATGCPAISIPSGFTEDGLPTGLQLVAPLGEERRLLEIASAVEAANPHWHRVPDLS